jgi:hypothetical protein
MGRLRTLLCKKMTVTKPKEMKTRSNVAESLRKSMTQSDEDDNIRSSLSF